MPFWSFGLCDAVTMNAPPACRYSMAIGTSGVGTVPSTTACTPALRMPRITAPVK